LQFPRVFETLGEEREEIGCEKEANPKNQREKKPTRDLLLLSGVPRGHDAEVSLKRCYRCMTTMA
jgi:hypothetical protein